MSSTVIIRSEHANVTPSTCFWFVFNQNNTDVPDKSNQGDIYSGRMIATLLFNY